MDKNGKIYVAGHSGMFGSALVRVLRMNGYNNIITKTHTELDLTRQEATEEFFRLEKPDYVFVAAAKVGGIQANNAALADFMYANMCIGMNVIHSAHQNNVKKLMYLGSACIYPKEVAIPIKENALLSAPLEKTNEGYALAKISGIKMCEFLNRQYGTDFVSVMPCNLYGPGDNFDPFSSHVIPALIRKFTEAKITGEKEVVVWGTGNAKREFMHIDDAAEACLFVMNNYSGNETVNVGYGNDISIRDLAYTISDIVGYKGEIRFDVSKPDGTAKRLVDSTKLFNMGWKPKIDFHKGLKETFEYFVRNSK